MNDNNDIDYIPIDIRKVKDKNRVYLSDDLMNLLGNPEIIVYSKFHTNGDTKVVVNNAHNEIIGNEIDAVKVDGRQRCTIPKRVRRELGIDEKNSNTFVGFFLANTTDRKVVEVINIAKLGKNKR